jgi:DNA gyrase subunit A
MEKYLSTTNTMQDLINKIKQKNVSSYLENEHRIYSVYTLQQRAIPFFNGLKPVHQRCLWKLKDVKQYEKVAKLSGMVLSIHPHGDASVNDAINQMTGPYCNNYPFFEGHGAFGTRINPTTFGSPRYVSARTSQFTKDVIFKDIEIINKKPTYDETEEEPELLLPLIPILLLNGIQGIATGYSTTILPRNLNDIIDRQIKVLKEKEIDNPLPYSKPIDNWAIRDANNPNKYAFLGECEIIDTSKARITKLPFGLSHQKVLENLVKMVAKHQIVDFVDKTKDEVDIVVTFKKAAIKGKSPEFVARKLKLSTSMTERIIVLDAETSKSVVEYNDAAKFIKDYTLWRLKYYPDRYQRLIEINKKEINRLRDIVIAIENDINSKATNFKSKQEMVEFVTKIGINDVDYIVSLPIYRFTKDEYDKVKTRIEELENENTNFVSIINDVDKQKEIYITELREIKRKYGKK